ncbi:hypothetical protein [Nocardia bovistercoris]|uniref:Uncharacterized protein n=1 Tax=Nocardia bovistercoris TaxID=2785916 RepID=A0A931IFU6_9NOCA|nr:hypothetical protein [Nocardia bovistercoris]MBH0780942.1 hypothetical protein [Nocardia bovistercoris]
MGSLWAILGGCGLLVAAAAMVGASFGCDAARAGHDSPASPFTVPQAHDVMQSHRGCDADGCPRKAAAFRALVDAGRIVPDARAEGYAN